MIAVIAKRTDGTILVYGSFTNRDAAEYFVSEYPNSEDKLEVVAFRAISEMGICPETGDGSYRYFNQ